MDPFLLSLIELINESKIYKAIIAGIAKYLRVARHSMLMMIKMYRIALSLKLQFLNFNANNFNLELSKKALKKVRPIKNY